MSRRDEREIARRLADLPAGEPPADLLTRLQADLPPALAIGEEAAARRRPAALDRRWLLAASLAAMVGAGAVSLHVMRQMPPESLAPAPRTAERQAAPQGGAPEQSAPRRLSPTPKPPAAPRAKETLDDYLTAAPVKVAPPAEPRALLGEGKLHQVAPAPVPAAPSGFEAKVAEEVAAAPEARAKARPPAALMRQRQEAPAPLLAEQAELDSKVKARPDAGGGPRTDALTSQPAAEIAAANAPAARPRTFRAPEVPALAAAYDDDAADKDGWTLAVGGTPPPPKVAGRPASGPPAGALWVRFRVRAAASTPPAAPEGARIEIAWSSRLLADRRLLGGGREAGPADVFAVSGDELRRGWTVVYEVRLAPAAGATGERLATLRLRAEGAAAGAPLREVGLTPADLAPSWMAAPAGLRLPCLAAAFAERRAMGGGDGYPDLLAAARDLAGAGYRGDRRAASLVARMARAERARPAGPP